MLEITWVMTTLAQSSAALIAIIGGLLISRYVSLHAQQNAADRRVADLTLRRTFALERLRTAQDTLDHFSIEVTAHDPVIYRELLKLPTDVKAEQIPAALLEVDPLEEGTNQDRLRQRLVDMRRELDWASVQLEAGIPSARRNKPWHEVNELDYPRREEHLWAWACTTHRRTVNTQLIELYWSINKSVLERQDVEQWGRGHRQVGRRPASRVPGNEGTVPPQPFLHASVRCAWTGNFRNSLLHNCLGAHITVLLVKAEPDQRACYAAIAR